MTFSHDFLLQIAHSYQLSKEQEKVFLLRLGEEKSYQEIANELQTSDGACLKRMGQIYQKINISGDKRGKENRLRIFLLNQLQQFNKTKALSETAESVDSLQQEFESLSPPDSNLENRETLLRAKEDAIAHHNLPIPDHHVFIGRQQQLTQLLQLLSFKHPTHLISVEGIGGVGKTALVLEAAYRCLQASSAPGIIAGEPVFNAIIFTSAKQERLIPGRVLPCLRIQRTLRDIFRAIAHTLKRLDINHSAPEDQLELIYASLASQHTLLIIDNLDTIEEEQDVLSFLYELPPTVKVVITTRKQSTIFTPIRLDPLLEDDCFRLIQYQAAEKQVTLSYAESQKLYEGTGGIPAAIVYAIGQMASGYPVDLVMARLSQSTGDVAHFCFEGSVQPLRGQPSHQLLMALALFPQPALKEAIAQVAQLDADSIAVAEGLAQLQTLSLIQQRQGRFSMLPLTRGYALAELENNPEFHQAARANWVNWYQRLSESYGQIDGKEWNEYPNLELEWENFHAVLDWCATQERYINFRTLWANLKGYCHVKGYWDDRLEWTAWLIQIAEQQKDWSTAAEAMYDRGWTLTLMGQAKQLEEADLLFTQAWNLREYKDFTFQLELSTNIAVLQIRQKNFQQANQCLDLERALLEKAELDESKYQRYLIHILYYQAEICFKTKNYEQAETLFLQAFEKSQALGWQRATNAIRNWLAEIAINLGNLEQGQSLLETGLPIAERNQDQRSIAFYKRSFAILEKVRDHLNESRRWASEALQGFENLRMMPEAEETRQLLSTLEPRSKE